MREFVALRDGAADLAVGSTLFWSAQVTELNVDRIAVDRLRTPGASMRSSRPVKEQLDAAIERAGVVPLAFAALGPRALATTTMAVRTPGDVPGLRVRIASAPLVADLFMALGAEPRTMSFADAQAAFNDGYARRTGRDARDVRRGAPRRARHPTGGAVGRDRGGCRVRREPRRCGTA